MNTKLETRLDTAGQQIDVAGLTAFLRALEGTVINESQQSQDIIRIITPRYDNHMLRYRVTDYAAHDGSLLNTAVLDIDGSVLHRGPSNVQRQYLSSHRLKQEPQQACIDYSLIYID
jgi:hypothetical protein